MRRGELNSISAKVGTILVVIGAMHFIILAVFSSGAAGK